MGQRGWKLLEDPPPAAASGWTLQPEAPVKSSTSWFSDFFSQLDTLKPSTYLGLPLAADAILRDLAAIHPTTGAALTVKERGESAERLRSLLMNDPGRGKFMEAVGKGEVMPAVAQGVASVIPTLLGGQKLSQSIEDFYQAGKLVEGGKAWTDPEVTSKLAKGAGGATDIGIGTFGADAAITKARTGSLPAPVKSAVDAVTSIPKAIGRELIGRVPAVPGRGRLIDAAGGEAATISRLDDAANRSMAGVLDPSGKRASEAAQVAPVVVRDKNLGAISRDKLATKVSERYGEQIAATEEYITTTAKDQVYDITALQEGVAKRIRDLQTRGQGRAASRVDPINSKKELEGLREVHSQLNQSGTAMDAMNVTKLLDDWANGSRGGGDRASAMSAAVEIGLDFVRKTDPVLADRLTLDYLWGTADDLLKTPAPAGRSTVDKLITTGAASMIGGPTAGMVVGAIELAAGGRSTAQIAVARQLAKAAEHIRSGKGGLAQAAVMDANRIARRGAAGKDAEPPAPPPAPVAPPPVAPPVVEPPPIGQVEVEPPPVPMVEPPPLAAPPGAVPPPSGRPPLNTGSGFLPAPAASGPPLPPRSVGAAPLVADPTIPPPGAARPSAFAVSADDATRLREAAVTAQAEIDARVAAEVAGAQPQPASIVMAEPVAPVAPPASAVPVAAPRGIPYQSISAMVESRGVDRTARFFNITPQEVQAVIDAGPTGAPAPAATIIKRSGNQNVAIPPPTAAPGLTATTARALRQPAALDPPMPVQPRPPGAISATADTIKWRDQQIRNIKRMIGSESDMVKAGVDPASVFGTIKEALDLGILPETFKDFAALKAHVQGTPIPKQEPMVSRAPRSTPVIAPDTSPAPVRAMGTVADAQEAARLAAEAANKPLRVKVKDPNERLAPTTKLQRDSVKAINEAIDRLDALTDSGEFSHVESKAIFDKLTELQTMLDDKMTAGDLTRGDMAAFTQSLQDLTAKPKRVDTKLENDVRGIVELRERLADGDTLTQHQKNALAIKIAEAKANPNLADVQRAELAKPFGPVTILKEPKSGAAPSFVMKVTTTDPKTGAAKSSMRQYTPRFANPADRAAYALNGKGLSEASKKAYTDQVAKDLDLPAAGVREYAKYVMREVRRTANESPAGRIDIEVDPRLADTIREQFVVMPADKALMQFFTETPDINLPELSDLQIAAGIARAKGETIPTIGARIPSASRKLIDAYRAMEGVGRMRSTIGRGRAVSEIAAPETAAASADIAAQQAEMRIALRKMQEMREHRAAIEARKKGKK